MRLARPALVIRLVWLPGAVCRAVGAAGAVVLSSQRKASGFVRPLRRFFAGRSFSRYQAYAAAGVFLPLYKDRFRL